MKQHNVIIFLIFVSVFFVGVKLTLATDCARSLVINQVNKQCGEVGCETPLGWQAYYPEDSLVLETPYGSCDYDINNREDYYRQCCQKLGFKYVDYTNIPYTDSDVVKFNYDKMIYEGGWKCKSFGWKDLYHGVIINEKNKECTTLISFSLERPHESGGIEGGSPLPEDCSITNQDWTVYEYQETPEIYKSKIITPFGECNRTDNIKTCCDKLGLSYVGYVKKGNIFNDQVFKEDVSSQQISLFGQGVVLLSILIIIFFLALYLIKKKKI